MFIIDRRDDLPTTPRDFQPQNVTFAYFADLPGAALRIKKARRSALAERALSAIDTIAAGLHEERRAVELL